MTIIPIDFILDSFLLFLIFRYMGNLLHTLCVKNMEKRVKENRENLFHIDIGKGFSSMSTIKKIIINIKNKDDHYYHICVLRAKTPYHQENNKIHNSSNFSTNS